jgi:predicted secreted protein
VRLTENPTTGYRWHLAHCDRSILEVTRDEFGAPDPAQHGAGGEHVWEVVARALGHSTFQVVYRRRWESAVPAKTFSLDVSVTE